MHQTPPQSPTGKTVKIILDHYHGTDEETIVREMKGTKQLPRPIIFRQNKKEIPADHIATNLKSLGVSKSRFYKDVGIK